MEHRISEFFWSSVGQLVFSALAAGATMIWGLFGEGINLWFSAVGAILVFAAIFSVVRLSGWWSPPLKVLIVKWLGSYEFSIREQSKKEFNFFFAATDHNGHTINVFQPKERDKFVFIRLGYNFENIVHDIPTQIHPILCRNLKIKLAQKGVGYGDLAAPLSRFL